AIPSPLAISNRIASSARCAAPGDAYLFTGESIILPGMNYARRHLRIGWWSLLVFATLGLVLESLHGFKVRAYLDVSNETRRLMWTLGHAHGTLLALVHVIFGLSLRTTAESFVRNLRLISSCLIGASVLLP